MKRQITIQHLLNITSGLYWAEDLFYNDSMKRVTGMNIEKYSAKYLFYPLGITNYEWRVEKNGLTSDLFHLAIRRYL